MTLVESAAAFAARCKAFSIADVAIAALTTSRLGTFGEFAFIVPFVSGQPDDNLLKDALTLALGGEPDVLTMPRYRRLLFESHAMVLSDTKSKVERTEESLPKKLPMPERTQRHEAQVKRLSPGISIVDWNEPSFALLDAVQQQYEDAQLRYIAIEACTCRVQEMAGVKKEQTALSDRSGFLKIGEKDADIRIDCGQDMFRIRQALLRRSLAYDQAAIISFPTMDLWHNYLFENLQREAPPGHRKVSLAQVLLADRQIFTRMAELCRHGLAADSSGIPPADAAMTRLMHDVRITAFLLPLLGGGGAQGSGGHDLAPGKLKPKRSDFGSWKEFKAASPRPKQMASPYSAPQPRGSKGSGKGSGKGGKAGKGKGKSTRPQGLEGTWTTSNSVRMCDGYNLGNCPENATTAAGSSCSQGLHVCCKAFCGGNHPYHQCTQR